MGGLGTKGTEQSVRSTISMRSMLLLGGLGACPPRKILKITYHEIDSGANFRQIMYTISVKVMLVLVKNTMYCGGEPEHKRVANKCMRKEMHAHNNGELY